MFSVSLTEFYFLVSHKYEDMILLFGISRFDLNCFQLNLRFTCQFLLGFFVCLFVCVACFFLAVFMYPCE